ncbi:MAG: prephenate dehydrogenase/arogenate dehydrogenase family protein, partial [Leptospira sp.]|nr:prephenate dehydrogenase/arogenate dehydrogenase family protein [Leptospira sp.]
MKQRLESVLIYGLGLMGASLALSMRKKGFRCKITGVVKTDESRREGIEKKIADEIFVESEFISRQNWNTFDFIIFSLPVDLTVEKLKLLPEDFTGLITDLGSTKKNIIRAVEEKFKGPHNYYSSHPMAG